MLAESAENLETVRFIMPKLRMPTMASKFRLHTFRNAILNNETHWSSSLQMLARYKEVRRFLEELGESFIDELLPNRAQDRNFDALLSKLEDLDAVTKQLQSFRRKTQLFLRQELFLSWSLKIFQLDNDDYCPL